MNEKIFSIVQARVGSTRLKGKVLKKFKGSLLFNLIKRLSKCKELEKLLLFQNKTKCLFKKDFN